MVRNAHQNLLEADMLMTCRLMFEEGVEDPMGESRHRSEAIKMGITRSCGGVFLGPWFLLTPITVVMGGLV